MRVFVAALMSVAVAGCGARRPAVTAPPGGAPVEIQAPRKAAAPQDTLETFMAKVRKLAAEARPQRQAPATVEATDPQLAAALAALTVVRSAQTLRAVGLEYARLGIVDRAHEYFNKALTVAPRDAATYDALARLWRDSGFPHLGLGDAHRAHYFAPASPVAHNTLGTLFQALGKRADARRSYERALQLDPGAAYALNNICYGWVLEGETRKAIAACEQALRLEPALAAARNNLGLAFAASGDVAAARTTFAQASSPAVAHYNTGIVQLARRRYAEALESFRAAANAQPALRWAQARIRQTEQLSRPGANE